MSAPSYSNLISIDEMINVGDVFIKSYNFILSNFVPESKKEIQDFTAGLVLREKPYMLVTKEGLPRAVNLVFSNEYIRDFIYSLEFAFFSRWGQSSNHVNGLMEILARGVGLANPDKNNVTPNEINNRLTDETDAFEIIKHNRWLAMLLLIQLFVTVDPNLINQSK